MHVRAPTKTRETQPVGVLLERKVRSTEMSFVQKKLLPGQLKLHFISTLVALCDIVTVVQLRRWTVETVHGRVRTQSMS